MEDVVTMAREGEKPARKVGGAWVFMCGLGLVAATCAAYVPALRSGFVWDDDMYLTENRAVQSPSGFFAIWSISWDEQTGSVRPHTPQYYPLVFTSFRIEHHFWGLNPMGYHLVNVLLHAVSAVLVWAIARSLRIPGAWFVAAVFALHPVHVESVAWITERKNVLSGVFFLLALLAYIRFDEGRKLRWYIIAGLLFIAALCSKTVTATLPIVLVLVLLRRNGRVTGRNLLQLLPLLLIGAAFGLLTAFIERARVGAQGAAWDVTFFERALILAPRALCFYAGKIAWPHPLMFVYPRWEIDAAQTTAYLPLVGVLALTGGLVIAARRVGWGPLLLLAFSAITLFPALGFFNVYPHRFSWVADHFQYLGSLGFIALITVSGVWLARWFPALARGRGRSLGLPVLVLLLLAGKTFWQSRSYADAVRLWTDTLERNPDAWIAALNLGRQHGAAGRYEEASQYFERAARYPAAQGDAYGSWGNMLLQAGRPAMAAARYRQALQVGPPDPRTHANLGVALIMAGRLDEAVEPLETALQLAPDYGKAWLNLGIVHSLKSRPNEAAQCLKRAVELRPESILAVSRYAEVLAELGRYDEAAQQYRAVLAWQPDHAGATRGLVMVLCQQGDYSEAIAVCRTGLAEAPDAPTLLAGQAWILATCPDDTIRDGAHALELARRAIGAGARDVYAFDAAAAASADVGDFESAIEFAEQALEQARRRGDQALSGAIEHRLALYREGKPYRAGS